MNDEGKNQTGLYQEIPGEERQESMAGFILVTWYCFSSMPSFQSHCFKWWQRGGFPNKGYLGARRMFHSIWSHFWFVLHQCSLQRLSVHNGLLNKEYLWCWSWATMLDIGLKSLNTWKLCSNPAFSFICCVNLGKLLIIELLSCLSDWNKRNNQ